MKKLVLIVATLALLTTGAFAQMGFGGEGKLSFSLFGGLGLSQAKGTSVYEDSWDAVIFRDIYEYADIAYKAKNGVFFGGAFTYMFSPNVGLQVGGGLFGRNVPNDSLLGYEAYLGSTQYYNEFTAVGTGKLTSIPLFLNFIGRFSAGMLDINVSAGPTLFLNSTEALATGIYGQNDTWYQWVLPWGWVLFETVDFLPIEMEIPSQSWSGFGANFGAGFDFNFSPMFAIFFDARYFLCGAKEFDWDYIAGTYDGLEGSTDWDFDQDDIDYLVENELTSAYKVNPSFFVISAGFKIRFGGGGF